MAILLTSNKEGTKLLKEKGITHWEALLPFVKKLPYGRNDNRHDFNLVIKEMKGSCSSKHAFLKKIALENHIQDVQLILCIYKMTEANTPGIHKHLSVNQLEFIPEAHCYLKLNGIAKDLTSQSSDMSILKK